MLKSAKLQAAVATKVQALIRGAKKKRQFGKELVMDLPHDRAKKYSQLFRTLEQEMQDQDSGIASFSVSMTTLEEIFLHLCEESERGLKHLHAEHDEVMHYHRGHHDVFVNQEQNLVSFRIAAFFAICKLQFLSMLRDNGLSSSLQLLPTIAFTWGLYFGRQKHGEVLQNPLALDSSVYHQHNFKVYQETPINDPFANMLLKINNDSQNINVIQEYLPPGTDGWDFVNQDVRKQNSMMAVFYLTSTQVFALINDSYMYSLPILMNIIDNGYAIRYFQLVDNASLPNATISTRVWPYQIRTQTFFDPASIIVGAILVNAMCMVSGHLVETVGPRNQIRMSGLRSFVYVTATFLVLVVFIYLLIGLLLIMVQIMRIETLRPPGAKATLSLLYLACVPPCMAFCCTWSYGFKSRKSYEAIFNQSCLLTNVISILIFLVVEILVGTEMIDQNIETWIHAAIDILFPLSIPVSILHFVPRIHAKNILENQLQPIIHEPTTEDYFGNINIRIIFIACLVNSVIWIPGK